VSQAIIQMVQEVPAEVLIITVVYQLNYSTNGSVNLMLVASS